MAGFASYSQFFRHRKLRPEVSERPGVGGLRSLRAVIGAPGRSNTYLLSPIVSVSLPRMIGRVLLASDRGLMAADREIPHPEKSRTQTVPGSAESRDEPAHLRALLREAAP